MNELTLVIPAKKEKESLPRVLDELKKHDVKKIIILEQNDIETIDSISGFNVKLIFQKKKGYGAALSEGIKNVQTKYFCIFNADGSFNPNELDTMYNSIHKNDYDFIFASRYEEGCSSEDDTLITKVGNYFFTKIGRIFFKLNITDILYTFVMGNTKEFSNLNIESDNFGFCVELPIKAKLNKKKITTSKSNERSRFAGKKKVNAFIDGFSILIHMTKLFFTKRN